MARPRNSVPSLLHHRASGQAKVRLPDGRDVYLGKFGSKESKLAYGRLVAELTAGGTKAVTVRASERTRTSGGPTVADVLLAFVEHAKRRYQKNGRATGTVDQFKAAIRAARELYGDTPAAEFGPIKLEIVRSKLAEPEAVESTGQTIRRSRSTVNRYAKGLATIFKWAAGRELVPASVPAALSMLEPIRRGELPLAENEPVRPVDDATIESTVSHLSPVVADMVRFQRLTGARPGEVCAIRPADVERSGDVWRYRPTEHKLEHHERDRIVLIGPKAQAVLLPYLLRPAEAFCFSPGESAEQHRAARLAKRKTPIGQGNSAGTNVVRKPVRAPGDRFDVASYRRAIKRAAEKAGVEAWGPNQLRHAFATEARRSGGLEAVQGLLGHSNLATSQIYAERHDALARDVAARIG